MVWMFAWPSQSAMLAVSMVACTRLIAQVCVKSVRRDVRRCQRRAVLGRCIAHQGELSPVVPSKSAFAGRDQDPSP